MKNEMTKNIETATVVACDGIGTLGCLSIVKKVHQQAWPQIQEATGGKKIWFITITLLTELMYIGFAIGSAVGAVCAIKERITDHNLQKELEACPPDFMTEEESGEDEDSSEKIKKYMDAWSSIANDDQRVYDK